MESVSPGISATERVIPLENVQLMFHYKHPFITHLHDGTIMNQPMSVLGGLTDTFFDAETKGEAGVIFVSFRPAGACFFFPFPLIEIKNQVVDLATVYYAEIKQVEELLQEKRSHFDKIEIIEQFLMKKFHPVPYIDLRMIETAVRIVKQNKGRIPEESLAEKLSVTGKTLERKFSEYVGLTPKKYSGLIRFQNILTEINSDISLTQCSYKFGYFDQSHFIKDFRLYCGYSPSEYRNRYYGCDNINTEFDPE